MASVSDVNLSDEPDTLMTNGRLPDAARLALDYRIETGLILEISRSGIEGISTSVALHAIYWQTQYSCFG